ncbi:MAG: hypothetical protein ACTHXA_04620 [Gulosibacter sp.]|uniref:hypothetical protein n=1 Tax=Gulosibacter sp. TaxID=2817531 RepID=UPI003F8F9F74
MMNGNTHTQLIDKGAVRERFDRARRMIASQAPSTYPSWGTPQQPSDGREGM